MNNIGKKFKELKQNGRKAFIAYTMAGYPSYALTEKIVVSMVESGVDIIELGVPFSDPIMDGKSIQLAGQKALENGATLKGILGLVKRLKKKITVPVALMSYLNPIYAYPFKSFVGDAADSGVDGLVIPDLSFEESVIYADDIIKEGMDLIQFVSPTTADARIKKILDKSSGFTYCISLTGVTGQRKTLPPDVYGFLKRVRKYASGPIAVGIGISVPEQVKRIKNFADGIIVGSAFINIQHDSRNILMNTRRLAGSLRKELDKK